VLDPKGASIFFILVGMVKQPPTESNKFKMSSEDFPALPGPPSASASSLVPHTLGGQFDRFAGDGSAPQTIGQAKTRFERARRSRPSGQGQVLFNLPFLSFLALKL